MKNNLRKSGFVLFFLLHSGFVFAQSDMKDSIFTLPAFVVESKGYKSSDIDSITLEEKKFESLAEILAFHSPIFIKNYGKGTLALTSFRGTSSRHTKILWNNMDINSIGLGVTDLSLVPAALMNKVDIAYGGGSLIHGAGGLGGSIILNNKVDWNKKYDLNISQYYGSFTDYRGNMVVSYGNRKWRGASKIVVSDSKNNFPYLNIAKQDTPTESQVNAKVHLLHLMQDIYYKPNKKNSFKASFWHFDNIRQIPPTLFTTDYSSLLNVSNRLFMEWKRITSAKSIMELRSAYSNDYVHFTEDTLSNIDSEHLGQFWNTQFRWSKQLKKIKLRSGLEYKMEWSLSDGYQEGKYKDASAISYKNRNIANLYLDARINSLKKIEFNMHARQLLINKEFSPFIYSASAEARLIKNDKLNAKTSFVKNFNLPSMYDLYWDNGGNSDLKPEDGWIGETGLATRFLFRKKIEIEGEVTGYISRIKNWILWTPGGGYTWTAENLKEVYRRGFELSFKAKFKIRKLNVESKSIYGYSNATNEIGIGEADLSVGKQLIYVPLHNVQTYVRLKYKKYTLTYENSYTGRRYITTDNTWYMPAFTIGNLVVGKVFEKNKMDVDVKLRVYNIWNRQYQSIPNRPMPGMYYGASIGIRFDKPLKKEQF
ncbi:MAG: TonB-dependent receptor plug domain-containing protein [Bacteroidetes bacterium]|nr:TonB-dependent receptor plug domain-containing protein [Bacteroidota bacterium]